MTISEIQSGIGSIPANLEKRKVDRSTIDAISERSLHLRTVTGREGNSHPQFLAIESQAPEIDIPQEK